MGDVGGSYFSVESRKPKNQEKPFESAQPASSLSGRGGYVCS